MHINLTHLMSSESRITNTQTIHRLSIYKDLVDSLPAAIYICDPYGYIMAYNEAAVALWGRRPEIGKDLWCGSWKIYDPGGTPISLDSCPMAQTLKSGEAVKGHEIIIEQPGGSRFNVLPYPTPLRDGNGVMIGAINMLVDVSHLDRYRKLEHRTEELKRITEELQRSEERYHLMIEEVEDYAIVLLSTDGIIQNWNRGAEKIKGYTEQEVVGKSFRIFYPEEDQKAGVPEKLLHIAYTKGKSNHEGWRVRKDGTRFWGGVSMTAVHDSNGAVIGFSKVTRDLTERHKRDLSIQQFNEDLKARNEMLRLSEERYHRMVADVEDYAIILLDSHGYIQNWNKGAQTIKGYSAEEIIGKHFSVFYSEEDRAKDVPGRLLDEALKNGKALYEGFRRRKDGSKFWGSVVLTALHADDGSVLGFTKVTRDLSDKKLAEEQLKTTSKILAEKNNELLRINEELSSFAYISSHDLQEPLRKIQTFSDRIMETEYENLSEKGKDYFKRMQAGAYRMQKLIQDILTYSRTTTSDKKLELTDLNELLSHAMVELEVMITEKKATIKSDRLPKIKVIPFQVQQLFSNLLNNALKFSKADVPPHVVVTAATVDGKKVPLPNPPVAKTYCHISFRDNGIGFEPEYTRKIFEVFQRLHGRSEYGGTGIGLAICKKIVENHNGVITAEGEVDKGATFHIYLPILDN